MPTKRSPRKGSLQFWPRKRAKKFLPRVNWTGINSGKSLKGFICYKAGMISAIVKDNSPDALMKGKQITLPCTVLECPPSKIFSIRFYKDTKVVTEMLAESLDKELRRKVKLPKTKKPVSFDKMNFEDYDDVKVIIYSLVKKTKIKKRPDLVEVGISGSFDDKINFIKENLNKELSVLDFFSKDDLIDVRGLTKGKGFSGPVKRFGIKLRFSKSEKGRRKVGSIGPWHPARVTFRVAMAGQMGMQTRVVYNNKIVDLGKVDSETAKKINLKNYGKINSDYLIVKGSIQGSAKRQLVLTAPLRETTKTKKQSYEMVNFK